MSQNTANRTPDKTLINKIKSLEKQIKDMKTNQLNNLVIPYLDADPASPIDGQVWYRTDTMVFKKRQNGVTKNWETA